MKKLLLLAAAFLVSSAAMAQPGPDRHDNGRHNGHYKKHHKKHKVWVPAHREHGRRVPGHYVWR